MHEHELERQRRKHYICTLYWPNECNNTIGDYLCYRMVLIAVMGTGSQNVERTVWCKPRSRHWWHTVQNNLCGSGWWKENPRMSQSTNFYMRQASSLHSETGVGFFRFNI